VRQCSEKEGNVEKQREVVVLGRRALRSLRKKAGLSQEALAQRFGCHRYSIIRYEAGERLIPEDFKPQLLAILKAAIAERQRLLAS
jgi:transcriptional regulator with XRE-family HTH domain